MTFRPSRKRLLIDALTGALAGAAIASTFLYLYVGRVPESFWWNVPFSALGLILSVFVTPTPGTLEITDGRIEWRTPFGRRRGFAIENLDKVRSLRRTAWDRVVGVQTLVAHQGEKAKINRWALGEDQTRRLFEALGLTQQQTTRPTSPTELPN
jgi:hypothetical protein